MLNPTARETQSLREWQEFEQEKTFAEMQVEYNLKVKELDLELAKVEASWNAILKLPATLLKLPMLIILAIGYCIAVATKQEPSDNFWKVLK